MDRVVVVGSGPSGVHFALTLLEQGRKVLMLDVGKSGSAPVLPDVAFPGLKRQLDDPAAYFLGDEFESLLLPGRKAEYYGFPPQVKYVFEEPERLGIQGGEFAPLISFAAGGLAQTWTGGCYPFSDEDLADFPFDYSELRPFYETVARRIGVSGADDDLAQFLPLHDGLLEPLELDVHSRLLLERYRARRAVINRRHRCYLGRSRTAVLSRDDGGRKACDYLGRCLWGCPIGALYTPHLTLQKCHDYEGFEYRRGLRVTHFQANADGRVHTVVAQSLEDGSRHKFKIDFLVLAAGTLSSSQILLESMCRETGQPAQLTGLMDNRQVLMPFVNWRMIGRKHDPESYQYNQLAMGLDAGADTGYVHALLTTLKSSLIHPIVQSIPASVGLSLSAFRNMHAALGILNINIREYRRDENLLRLEPRPGEESQLFIEYRSPAGETEKLRLVVKSFRRILSQLGCFAPKQMIHVRPIGASVHYAGTVPMCRQAAPFTTDPLGRSRDFPNLILADGTTFPSLPAKNLTFTLMANATRIATQAFY